MSAESWIDLLKLDRPLKFNEFTVNFNPDLFNAESLSIDLQEKLDQLWNNLLASRPPGRVLFNQTKFRLHSVELNADLSARKPFRVVLNLGLTDYKSFICTQQQNLSDELRSKLDENNLAHPLGVGSLLITADDFLVFIKRSAAAIDLPNLYDIPGGHAEPSNLNEFTTKNIVEEIFSSTVAECVDETNVERTSLLIDSDFHLLVVMRNQWQRGRPAIIFSLRTTMNSNELQKRYDLQTHAEAFETSELKFWPLDRLSDLLNDSKPIFPLTPSCHVALTSYAHDQLKEIRAKTNADFVPKRNPEERLTVEDEAMVLRYYEVQLKEFCNKFEPPMTTTAITIAVQYFKRFYLYNSVMNYHPKDIYLICVYLTCKTEEIRISISTFMENILRNPTLDQTPDILLAYELVLIEKLHFHLVVHTAHRPFEGLIIDLKTHYLRENVNDADRLRLSGYEFLERTLTTDVYFLFPPSQIALTALVYASITTKVNIDDYILKRIYHSLESEEMQKIKDTIRSIATVVKNPSKYKKADVNKALEKLEKCYNIDLDPRSDQYKKDRLEQFQKLSDYEDKYLPQ